jgi:hypothetical protein
MDMDLEVVAWMNFNKFVSHREFDFPWRGAYLDEYIYVWLTEGDAVAMTAGDFDRYLLCVIFFMNNLWSGNYDGLEFVGTPQKPGYMREISSLTSTDSERPKCLDPAVYRAEVARRLGGPNFA